MNDPRLRVIALVDALDQLPREGDIPCSFVVGLYPAGHPTLPAAKP